MAISRVHSRVLAGFEYRESRNFPKRYYIIMYYRGVGKYNTIKKVNKMNFECGAPPSVNEYRVPPFVISVSY